METEMASTLLETKNQPIQIFSDDMNICDEREDTENNPTECHDNKVE